MVRQRRGSLVVEKEEEDPKSWLRSPIDLLLLRQGRVGRSVPTTAAVTAAAASSKNKKRHNMKVGVVCSSLGFEQPSDEAMPATTDYDLVVVCLLHSSYRCSAEYRNAAVRATAFVDATEVCEAPGGHSPFRPACLGSEFTWSWADDDGDELWVDVKPCLLRASQHRRRRRSEPLVGQRLSEAARLELGDEAAAALARAHDIRVEAEEVVGTAEVGALSSNFARRPTASSVCLDPTPAANDRRQRLLQRASGEYLRIVETRPRTAGAWYGLGLCQRALGDPVASLRALDMCIKLRPSGALDGNEAPGAAWNARGRTLLRAEQPLQALESFRRALAADPRRHIFAANVALTEDAIRARAESTIERRERQCPQNDESLEPILLPSSDDDDRHRYVSAARRLASEQKATRTAASFAEYDREHNRLLRSIDPGGDPAQPRLSFADLGVELRRGSEHLARFLRQRMGRDWRLLGARRAGHLRLRVYARRDLGDVRVDACLTCAHVAGAAPASGGAAVAIRLWDGTTLCFVGLDLAAAGEAVEAARAADDAEGGRSTWMQCSHLDGLRNRIAAAALSSLRIGDIHRGPGEQFDHVVIVGNLGYEFDCLETEIVAQRAFAGFRAVPTPDDDPAETDLSLARDFKYPPRVLWRGNLDVHRVSSLAFSAVPTLRTTLQASRTILVRNVTARHMPCTHGGAPLTTYVAVCANAGAFRSELALACRDDDYAERCSAAWPDAEFLVQLATDVVLVAVWARDANSADALVGVAQVELTDDICAGRELELNATLDGRATALVRCAVRLVQPDEARAFWETHRHRSFSRRSSSCGKLIGAETEDNWPHLGHLFDASSRKIAQFATWRHTWDDRRLPWAQPPMVLPFSAKEEVAPGAQRPSKSGSLVAWAWRTLAAYVR